MPTLGTALTPEQLRKGSCWTLSADVQGYARSHGSGLATQACAGRGFRVLTNPHPNASRVRTALIGMVIPVGWPSMTSTVRL
jgi:hypothetical protein